MPGKQRNAPKRKGWKPYVPPGSVKTLGAAGKIVGERCVATLGQCGVKEAEICEFADFLSAPDFGAKRLSVLTEDKLKIIAGSIKVRGVKAAASDIATKLATT
ncbi:MAG: hypothetical protein V1676_03320 [Candidatus Diapherotrites archaeon]